MTGLDPSRVAEIHVTGPAGSVGGRASGYRVTGSIVVTAEHAIRGHAGIIVRFDADQAGEWSVPASVMWSDTAEDSALLVLRLPPGPVSDAASSVPAATYGRVGDRSAVIEAVAVGFPWWKLRADPAAGSQPPSRYRDMHQAACTISTLSNRRSHTLELETSPPDRRPEAGRSPWEGMSGAAVWAGNRIVGVVRDHVRAEGPNHLTATRIDRLIRVMPADVRQALGIADADDLVDVLDLPAAPLMSSRRADSPATAEREGRPPGVAHTLPADVASFTGRAAELGDLMAAIDDRASGPGIIRINVIGGMAGVGKTALAVHVAHMLASRFPDGQLFVPLHANTPGQDPVDPADALAGLLLTTGTPPQLLPAALADREAMWRDRMSSRRVLLLLDDAGSSSQVRPLLPASAGTLVLITSRVRLAAMPDAHALPLEVLEPAEAAKLFARLAGRPGTPADEETIATITGLCGSLPLAVSLAAGQFKYHPSWNLRYLASQLESAAGRLNVLAAESESVTTAFNLSYRHLSVGQQQLFRRLGLHPGPDIDAYSAAALDGSSLDLARTNLEALYDRYLLTEPAPGRYRFHDLIREHARLLAMNDPRDQQDASLGRLLNYYQHASATASASLARQSRPGPGPAAATPPTPIPDLSNGTAALSWARAERASLLSCLDHATRTGQDTRIVALTAGLSALLRHDGPWTDAIARHESARLAARRASDQIGAAGALSDLGVVRRLTGDHRGAAAALQEALDIYRSIGDQLGQANSLSDLGISRRLTGDHRDAAQALQEALDIYRSIGDQLGQANSLNHLGVVRRLTGDHRGAAAALQEALDIYRGIGDRTGQATTLNSIGALCYQTGNYQDATTALQEALKISRDLGDRLGQANALNSIGALCYQTGNYQDATTALQEALKISRDLGSQLGQAYVLSILGIVQRLTGDLRAAADTLEEAHRLSVALGDRPGQANALSELGTTRRLAGDHEGAHDALQLALGLYRSIGDRSAQAAILNETATLHRARGDPRQAETSHREALHLARDTASTLEEGRALAGLGRSALAAGRTTEAYASLKQAHEIFARIGAAETAGLSAELRVLGQEPSESQEHPLSRAAHHSERRIGTRARRHLGSLETTQGRGPDTARNRQI